MTEEEYRSNLARIEQIFSAKLGTPEGDELEMLVNLVEAYEKVHFQFPSIDHTVGLNK